MKNRNNDKDFKVFIEGDLDSAKAYLSGGGDIESVDGSGMTPLMLSSYNGHVNIVEWLLKKKVNVHVIVEQGDYAGYMAIHFAASSPYYGSNKYEMCVLLLKHGAYFDAEIKPPHKQSLSKHPSTAPLQTPSDLVFEQESDVKHLFDDAKKLFNIVSALDESQMAAKWMDIEALIKRVGPNVSSLKQKKSILEIAINKQLKTLIKLLMNEQRIIEKGEMVMPKDKGSTSSSDETGASQISRVTDRDTDETRIQDLEKLRQQINTTLKGKAPEACQIAMEACGLGIALCYQVSDTVLREQWLGVYEKLKHTIIKYFAQERLNIKASKLRYLEKALQGFKVRLDDVRESQSTWLKKGKSESVWECLGSNTKSLANLFKDMCDKCLIILDFDEEHFYEGMAVVSLGSLGTGLATAYSDIEYLILLNEERMLKGQSEYKKFAGLLRLLVTSFGEAPLSEETKVYRLLDESLLERYKKLLLQRKGFRVDEKKRAGVNEWRFSLISSKALLTGKKSRDIFEPGNHLAASLLVPGFVLGDEVLFEDYRNLLARRLRAGDYTNFLNGLKIHDHQMVTAALVRYKSNPIVDIKALLIAPIQWAYELNIKGFIKGHIPKEHLLSGYMHDIYGEKGEQLASVKQALESLKEFLTPLFYKRWEDLVQKLLIQRLELQSRIGNQSLAALTTIEEIDKAINGAEPEKRLSVITELSAIKLEALKCFNKTFRKTVNVEQQGKGKGKEAATEKEGKGKEKRKAKKKGKAAQVEIGEAAMMKNKSTMFVDTVINIDKATRIKIDKNTIRYEIAGLIDNFTTYANYFKRNYPSILIAFEIAV